MPSRDDALRRLLISRAGPRGKRPRQSGGQPWGQPRMDEEGYPVPAYQPRMDEEGYPVYIPRYQPRMDEEEYPASMLPPGDEETPAGTQTTWNYPFPNDAFSYLLMKTTFERGEKPHFMQEMQKVPSSITVGTRYYTPGTYGYIPRGAAQPPATPQQPEQPPEATGALYTPVPEDSVAQGTQLFSVVPTDFVAQTPNYKDRLQEWRNKYYYAQFDENHQFIPGVNIPNHNGETLSKYPGALGWDPNGDPFYGSGLRGFWNKISNQIKYPYGIPKEEIKEPAAARRRWTPGYTPYAQQIKTTPGVLGKGTQSLVGDVLDVMNLPAVWTKQLGGVIAAVADYGEESYMPKIEPKPLSETMGLLTEGVQGVDLARLWQNFVENKEEIFRQAIYRSPQVIIDNALRNLSLKTPQELKSDVEEGLQSGKLLYTTMLNPLIREEFVRRYRAGENPDLLKMELENPWAELGGELVFDPLNIIGIGPLKAAKGSKYARNAVSRTMEIAPEVEKLMEAGEISKVTKLSDVKIGENIEQLARAVADDILKHSKKRSRWAVNYAPWQLTATGKREAIARNMGEMFARLAADSADNGDVVDAFRAMYQIAQGAHANNLDLVTTGLTGASRMPNIRYALSEDGKDIGLMLYKLLGDDPKKFFPTMQQYANKGLPELIEWLGKKMDQALVEAFPTVSQRITRGEKVSFAVRVLNDFDRLTRPVYKTANSFFTSIYMAGSPGYFVRNVLNNAFTISVDEGLGFVAKNPAKLLKKTQDMLGGVTPRGIGGFSRGVQGIEILDTKAAEKLGKMGKFIREKNFAALSNKAEYKQSIQVVYAAVKRTMDKLVKPGKALPAIDSLVEAGMDRRTARTLYKLVRKHNYNVDAAVAEFIKKNGEGTVWALDTLDFLSNKQDQIVRDFDLDALVLDILQDVKGRGGTADEAVSAIQSRFDEMVRAAEDALLKEPAVIDQDAEGIEIVADLLGARRSGVELDNLDTVTYYTQANSNVFRAFRTALGGQFSDDIERKLGVLYAQQRIRAEHANDIVNRIGLEDFDFDVNWRQLGLPGEAPHDPKIFKQRMWKEYYFDYMRRNWEALRDEAVNYARAVFQQSGGALNPGLFADAEKHYELAKKYDTILRNDEIRLGIQAAINRGDAASAARIYGEQFGIPASETQHLLNAINKYGDKKYTSLRDIPLEDLRPGGAVRDALARRLRVKVGLEAEPGSQVTADVAREAQAVLEAANTTRAVPPVANNAPTASRMFYEQREGIQNFLNTVVYDGIRNNWNEYLPAMSSPETLRALDAWRKQAKRRISEARLIAQNVANAARDFTLLNYDGKRYFDLALAYIFPYHFWYNRTYAHWLQRLAWSPEVLAAYAKYKNAMASAHAGAPEWWRYNVTTNDLLGIDNDNPLFFNLEATLFPLNGLTGVDFDDPQRRVNWLTAFVDDLGKLGPTVWTPINIAIALSLQSQGEEEAAQRWGGRLIPQTAALKSILALNNISVKTGQGLNEFDPMVLLFSNGMDPYERRRVGRALGMMVDQGMIDQKSAIQAAYDQQGDVWDQAVMLAQQSRAFGQLSSTALGVGFKARSQTDMQIDMFDQEWRLLWAQANDMSPEQVRMAMDYLRDKYPFMDTVILSRKSGLDRDRSLAYNVLGRIPPGQKSEIAEMVSLDEKLMDKFYADKGRMDKWAKADYQAFMAAILNIGAVLDLPDDATRAEWSLAKQKYDELNQTLIQRYGENILNDIELFYQKRKENPDQASAWLDNHPEVESALEFRDRRLISEPALAPYYAGIDKIENYYRSLMWDDIYTHMPNLDELLDNYGKLKLLDPKAAKKFWDKNLKKYVDIKEYYSKKAAESIVAVEQRLNPPRFPDIIEGENMGVGAQNIVEQLNTPAKTPYDYTWREWVMLVPDPVLLRLIVDSFHGEKLSSAANDEIEYLASRMDIDPDIMLRLMQQSYYNP